MTKKERYIEFYSSHPDICIFSSPWWLDAVCGANNWDVIFVEDKNGKVIASFPYVLKKHRLGIKSITMPPLTQKLGVYIFYDEQENEYKRIEYENEIYNEIIAKLPSFDTFSINFDQAYKNWLSFYWQGFSQTSRYSYRIYDIKDWNTVFLHCEKSKKKKIRKGEKFFILGYDLPAETFYDFFEEVIAGRSESVSYSKKLFCALYDVAYAHNAGKVFYCTDRETGNIAAVKFIVWDLMVAYDLIGIRAKAYNAAGATEFLTYECIKYVSQFVDTFDFEGSMIKGVEDAYRGYGAHQTEYYSISKDSNPILPLVRDGLHLLSVIKHKFRRGGVQKYSRVTIFAMEDMRCGGEYASAA